MRTLRFGLVLLASVLGLSLGCGESESGAGVNGGSAGLGAATAGSGNSSAGTAAGKAGTNATAGATSGGTSSGGNGSNGGTVTGGGASGHAATTGGQAETQAGAGNEAGGGSALVDCDPKKILCKSIAPECPAGEVPSVDGLCYGECVQISRCRCAAAAQCPEPDQYTCWAKQHCGPFVQ